MEQTIPTGWQEKRLWEVTNWDKRFNAVPKEKQKHILSFKHILAEELKSILVKGGSIKLLATGKFDGYTTKELARDNINKGEVLTLPSGGTAAIKYYDGEFVDSGNIIAQSSDLNEYYLKFIYYYLLSINAIVADKYKGTSIKHPYMPEILEIVIPFPSISEQKRIVKKLDDIMYKIDCMKANAEFALSATKDLFDNLLDSKFKTLYGSAPIKKLSDVCDVRDGTHDSPKYLNNGGHPFVTSKNLKNDKIDMSKITYISDDDYKKINERSKVDVGDVLFAMIGTIGNPVVITEEPTFAIKNVALFKNINELEPHYLRFLLKSPCVLSKMQKEANGTTQKFVSLKYLRNFMIPVPDIMAQREIADSLEIIRNKAEELSKIYEQKIKLLDDLKQSILKQAFAGEL